MVSEMASHGRILPMMNANLVPNGPGWKEARTKRVVAREVADRFAGVGEDTIREMRAAREQAVSTA